MADFLGQRYGVIAEVQHQRFSAASFLKLYSQLPTATR